MERTFEFDGKNFKLQSEASAYETGYGVYFKSESSKRGSVKFDVFLTASMQLVAIPFRVHGFVSRADYDFCKRIVSEELAANPTVFHIAENGYTELRRHKYALDEAIRFAHVDSLDPEVVALEKRIGDLDNLINTSRKWSKDPKRGTFKAFLEAYREETFSNVVALSDRCSVLPAMGPVDLVSYVKKREAEYGPILVIPTGDALSRVPRSVAQRPDFSWPLPWKFSDEEKKWMHVHRLDFANNSEKLKSTLGGQDALALVWTRRTDAAAFERIASMLSLYDNDPLVLIGSPEGTVTGRARELKMSLKSEPVASPKI